jgi:hypothetical protein
LIFQRAVFIFSKVGFFSFEVRFFFLNKMTTRFYYEDDQGRIVDEQGNGAMDWDEEVTPFHLKTLTRIREYYEKQEDAQLSSKEDIEKLDIDMEEVIAVVKNQIKIYHRYSNEKKLLFVYYNRTKLFDAAKSGRLAGGINERTAQKWVKKLKEDKEAVSLSLTDFRLLLTNFSVPVNFSQP